MPVLVLPGQWGDVLTTLRLQTCRDAPLLPPKGGAGVTPGDRSGSSGLLPTLWDWGTGLPQRDSVLPHLE